MIRKYSYLFWLAIFIASIAACSILNHNEKQRYLPGHIARAVEQRLNKTLDRIQKDSADGFFSKRITGSAGSTRMPDYIVFVYEGDSLTGWNSNLLNIPPAGIIGSGDSLILINNFYCYRKELRAAHSDRTALVFIPLASAYKYDNAFLQSQLLAFPAIGSNFSVSGVPVERSVAVRVAAERKTIAYLSLDDNIEAGRVPSIYLQVIFIAALFALFIAIIKARDVIAVRFNLRYSKCFILLFTFLLLFILRTFVITSLPFNLENTLWVSPALMSSNDMLRSFLDLAVYAILGCAALYDAGLSMRYFKRSGNRSHYLFKHQVWAVLIIFACFFIIFFLAINSIDVLVIDSKIPFDVYDFFSLNQYTFIGLFVLLVITFDILILLRIARAAVIFGFRNVLMRYLIIIIIMLIVCLLNYGGHIRFPEMATVLLLLMCMQFFGVIPFLYVPLLRTNRQAFSTSMYMWMMIVCTGVAWALMYFNFIKEHETRKVFAQDQAGKPDIEAEINLASVLQKIQDDNTLKMLLKHTGDSAAQYSSDYVINNFFGDKFGQYKKYVYVFSKAGAQLNKRNDLILAKVKSAINTTPGGSNVINDANFRVLYNHNFPKYTYWARIPVVADNKSADTIASLGILLSHDIHYTGNVYADLNQRNEITDKDYYLKYTFAHYLNNHLIYTNGYDFNNYIAIHTNSEFTFREKLSRSVLIYSFSPQEQLVVNYDRNLLYIFIATFSYFALTIIVSYILFFVLRNFVVEPNMFKVKRLFKGSSLRTKINIAILIIVSLSLVIVGIFTISFLINRFKNEQKQYLHHRVEAALSVMFGTNPYNTYIQTAGSIDSLQEMLPRLYHYATIENLTINIYNIQGELYRTNRPNIRKAGMISDVINPSVLAYLQKGKAADYITDEYYGNLRYESIYACINNDKGATVGYINIPYYATNASVTSEISDVLVALINLYAFIFFIAGLVAILISNNVIKSFKLLRQKFQQVNIKHNEPIRWPYRDEIGQLVTEYNAMIHRVENMATKLAHTERELAWREIAQQVAHEIKNPLTPMKLQIQYLQSAIQAKRDDVPELSRKVTESLLEQVENLNLIAGAFSDFAKVPVAHFEHVSLKQFLPALVCLFDTREVQVTMQFENESAGGQYYIEADKSFLNRIFTNLIKNALQSVPPDREANVAVNVNMVMDKVIIAVSDNGKGIDEATVPHIFTPYFTTKSTGSGLGLSMIKNMVEQMNGAISFKTKQDVGTTFYLTFPKVK